MSPPVRKAVLAIHLTVSVGWIGAVCAYLALALAIPATKDPATVRAAWIAMELVGWRAVVPLALLSLVTGTLLALLSTWGLFRHYWVLVSFVTTIALVVVLLLHMPDVSDRAELARRATDAELAGLGSDVGHTAVALVLLVGVLVLNIYKPQGLTRYGWRRLQARRGSSTPAP